MNLIQIKYFLAVATDGSVTVSAKRLGLTQPALTRGIRQLEEELGVQLFDRLPRSMRLTRFGESYLRHAQSIFVQLENAQAELRHMSSRTEETIVIGAGPTWIREALPQVVGQLARNFPDIAIKVRSGYDQQLISMLRSGEVDFLLTEISRDPETADLLQEPLIVGRYVVACRRDHPLAGQIKLPLHRLLDYPWAMPDLALNAQQRLSGLFHTESLVPPTPRFQSTSLDFIFRLLASTDALSFVVASSLEHMEDRHIVALDIDCALPLRQAGIVRRADSWFGPGTAALLTGLRDHCAANPYQ